MQHANSAMHELSADLLCRCFEHDTPAGLLKLLHAALDNSPAPCTKYPVSRSKHIFSILRPLSFMLACLSIASCLACRTTCSWMRARASKACLASSPHLRPHSQGQMACRRHIYTVRLEWCQLGNGIARRCLLACWPQARWLVCTVRMYLKYGSLDAETGVIIRTQARTASR